MFISAFLQLYNELSNGHLRRCLDNCRQWADAIYIYDDASTDGSQSVYLEYTSPDRIIFGARRDFAAEIFHKQQLLSLVQSQGLTDWIAWIDGDAVFDRSLTEKSMRSALATVEKFGGDSATAHNLNLWRHPAFMRIDSQFNDLEPVCFWKCSPKLRYEPAAGLHRVQYPMGLERTFQTPHNILHYGFADYEGIARKYTTYRGLGAAGFERLADETSLRVDKVPRNLYPAGLLPADYDTCRPPERISYADLIARASG